MIFLVRLGASLLLLSCAGSTAAETPTPPPAFSAWQRSVINSLSLRAWPETTALAPDGNALRDDEGAARLGQQLFFDPRFSANGGISCASCHQPSKSFTDGLTVATGLDKGSRNTPSLIGVTLNRWYFADGRRDSAWSQAVTPFETPHEMGSDRLSVVRTFFSVPSYRDSYVKIFAQAPPAPELLSGTEPASPLSNNASIRAAWSQLSASDQQLINRHFSNLGKLLAAYEHRLRPPVTAFDRYAEALATEGEAAANKLLSETARAGLRFFINPSNQCLKCHTGPTLSNGEFHNIGTGNSPTGHLDPGRSKGPALLAEDPFNCHGAFNTGPTRVCELGTMFGTMGANVVPTGAFRTPTLRQLRDTSPYFHDGRAATLTAVFEHYRDPPEGYGYAHELWPARALDEQSQRQLAAFLDSLSGPPDTDNR